MSNNNDLDPAASTQMFQAFVERGEAKNPTTAASAPTASTSSGSGKVIGIVLALAVVVAVIAFVLLHK
ncbi:hypothetical protein KDL01_18030 [Actinospica durhamensis]|uniref:Uncharacterized protein n=1 Tax=Actinospica durhamensis TaxID=1508375 RepID=A0A941ERJ2_9ACTN|nr:hypothetical protein [Actinospica durhamensis]MBR7835177.1 hypothetical protein [Actinospica durhamensis]